MKNSFIKSRFKSFISMLLILAVMISCTITTSASSSQLKDTDVLALSTGAQSFEDADDVIYPTIVLPGLSFSDFYLLDDAGNHVLDSTGKEMHAGMFIVDPNEFTSKAKGLIFPLIKSVFSQKDSGLSKSLADFMECLTRYTMNNPDGSFVYNLALEKFDHPVSEMTAEEKAYYYNNIPLKEYSRIAGEDKLYIYTYNPFGNVLEQSQGIKDYIDMVKSKTGYDKVNICTMSMGTTLLNQYLNLENADYSSIHRIVNMVPIFDGNEVITELLINDFTDNEQFYANDYLPAFAGGMFSNKVLGHVLNIALRLLSRETRANLIETGYTKFADSIRYSSQGWTMVQSGRYQELAQRFLSTEETKPLRAVIDTYMEAQKNVEKNLLKAQNEYGVGVYNFCGYGINSLNSPASMFSVVSSDAKTNSDCLVSIDSAAFGVTHVPWDEKLSDEYINSLPTKAYVSPDRTIDASTCPFRDTTWFYYQQIHWMFGNDAAINLSILVLLGIVDDVNSDPVNYPQFNWNRDTLSITNGEYMYVARDILNNSQDYDPALIANLQKAFDKMYEIYKITNLYEYKDKDISAAEAAKTAQNDLINALADFDVCKKVEETKDNKISVFLLSKVSSFLAKKYGRNGFFD